MSLIERAARRFAELQRSQGYADGIVRGERPQASAAKPRRRVNIDLARLHHAGFVTPDAPASDIAQELRALKWPILRTARNRESRHAPDARRVMVTSALPGEGKTFAAINLAMSMATEIDTAVMLIDGDVAHATALDVLGVPPSPGLLDLLADGDLDIDDVVLDTNVERLTLLPAGTCTPRAAELLASARMESVVASLTARFADCIIVFDAPPLLAATEARVLATYMGQVVLVVAAESTRRAAVNEALAMLERCRTVYTMLNKAVAPGGAGYGHYSRCEPG